MCINYSSSLNVILFKTSQSDIKVPYHWPWVHTEASGLPGGRNREGCQDTFYWSDTAQCRDFKFTDIWSRAMVGGGCGGRWHKIAQGRPRAEAVSCTFHQNKGPSTSDSESKQTLNLEHLTDTPITSFHTTLSLPLSGHLTYVATVCWLLFPH